MKFKIMEDIIRYLRGKGYVDEREQNGTGSKSCSVACTGDKTVKLLASHYGIHDSQYQADKYYNKDFPLLTIYENNLPL